MNFWEARQAALEGKKVKMLKSADHYDFVSFTADFVQFDNAKIDAVWEIVEEPKTIVRYMNIYNHDESWWASHATKQLADKNARTNRVNCLEIITDENGRLVSAKNV